MRLLLGPIVEEFYSVFGRIPAGDAELGRKLQKGGVAMALAQSILRELFPADFELVPGINELYELELAYLELSSLEPAALVRQAGYISRVGGAPSHHFRLCAGKTAIMSEWASRQSFLSSNVFRTGYATHGLFPYRGKFHPQMVRGILNAMGLRPGMTVLDPMVGSGTTLVEAAVMGIDSVGLDVNPFARYLATVKIDALSLSKDLPGMHKDEVEESFRRFGDGDLPRPTELRVLHLAYMDALGYASRMPGRDLPDLYATVVKRYTGVLTRFRENWSQIGATLGDSQVLDGDARAIPLPANSVDGILFSPPYSFALDYAENDQPQLELLGFNLDQVRSNMVGLRGRTQRERVATYLEDMRGVLCECHRVLRPGKVCSVVIGSNSNQLARALDKKPEDVSLQNYIIDMAQNTGFRLERRIPRQIVGMANTMRNEDILFLAKG